MAPALASGFSIRPHPDVIHLLLEHQADPNVLTHIEAFGEVSPLMLAAGRGHLEVTRNLLAHGADPGTVCDVEGFGPTIAVTVAEIRGFDDVVRLLRSGHTRTTLPGR